MKRLFLVLAAVAAIMSCQKENPAQVQDQNEINFELGIRTKASATAFETGDQVAVYAVEYATEEAPELQIAGNFINNEKLFYDGLKWLADKTLYWSDKPCDFYALYPSQNASAFEAKRFGVFKICHGVFPMNPTYSKCLSFLPEVINLSTSGHDGRSGRDGGRTPATRLIMIHR